VPCQNMKRRQILKTLPFLISAWTSATYAQNHTDVTDLFDRAAAKHKREFDDLIRSRARTLIDLPDASAKSIARVLATSEDKNTAEATYLNKAAVLFYSYEKNIPSPHSKGELQIWLVNAYGVQAYHRQNIPEKQISEAISNLRDSIGVNTLQRTLVPQERAGIKVIVKPTHSEGSLDRSVDELTQILLPTEIADKLTTVEHLIIVPVLGIGTVPYPILNPFKDGTSLIDRMSISIAPSLFDIGRTLYKWDSRKSFSSPLIVGNPYLPESSEWSASTLPGAEQEAQAVAKMMEATPLIGKEATKTEIVSRARKSSLLYFATHGVASSRDPLLGGFLMLSAQKLEQGWWTAQEIQNTRLTADIAILSACQTGLGKIHDAGMIGLARAFQIAGVPRVVMSLWNVNDQVTNILMQTFVRNLEHYIPSEALRQAMLEVRKDHPKPSEWASFLLFGTPR
jgi:CHAT domain-containing protein